MSKPRTYKRPLLREQLPELIATRPMSAKEIAKKLDRNESAVNLVTTNLYADGKIHIGSWLRQKGHHAAQWLWGPGEDAPKLENLTVAELCANYRNSPHGRKVHKASQRRWYRENDGAGYKRKRAQNIKVRAAFESEGVAAIDPLLAAIMGM